MWRTSRARQHCPACSAEQLRVELRPGAVVGSRGSSAECSESGGIWFGVFCAVVGRVEFRGALSTVGRASLVKVLEHRKAGGLLGEIGEVESACWTLLAQHGLLVPQVVGLVLQLPAT